MQQVNLLVPLSVAVLATLGLILGSGCEAVLGSVSSSPTAAAKASSQVDQRPGSSGTPIGISADHGNRQTIEHLLGSSVVPKVPQRVCSLDFTDEVLAIGAIPAAASCSATGFPDYLRPQLRSVTPVYQMLGTMFPDLETIVRVQPDLILTSNTDPQTFVQLSKIAPVVVMQRSEWDDRQRILDIGTLLGKEEDAKAVLAAYQAKVSAARDVLRQKVGDEKVAFFRVFGRQMYIHGHTRGGLLLYDELGLNPPTILEESPRGYMLSPETLLQLDAQHLFVAAENNLGAQRSWDILLDHPAWRRVPAVRQGNVYSIHQQHQWLVPGIQGRSRMIDEVLAAIAPDSLDSIETPQASGNEAVHP